MDAAVKYPYQAYPNMAKLYPQDLAKGLVETGDPERDLLYRLLVDDEEHPQAFRQRFESLLARAARHGVLDADLAARLQGSREAFWAAHSELEAADFFEERGWRVHFGPQGRGGHRGEFDLTAPGDQRISVEVKTLFDREAIASQSRLGTRVMAAAERVPLPYLLEIEIVREAADFRSRALTNYLTQELGRLSGQVDAAQHGAPMATIRYEDPGGLQAEFKVRPLAPEAGGVGCMFGSGVWALDTPRYIRHSLTKAYRQLPDRPNLVVLRSRLQFGVDEHNMLNALYGSLQLVITRETLESRWVRAADGFFGPGRNRRVSAVALLKSSGLIGSPDCALDVYHYEIARRPLNWQSLKGPAIRHLVRVDDNTLEWME